VGKLEITTLMRGSYQGTASTVPQARDFGKKRIWRAKREVRGRARLQSCRKGGKIDGALAPEVWLPLTGILRDYMPDSKS
jgi:hypothetical protein